MWCVGPTLDWPRDDGRPVVPCLHSCWCSIAKSFYDPDMGCIGVLSFRLGVQSHIHVLLLAMIFVSFSSLVISDKLLTNRSMTDNIAASLLCTRSTLLNLICTLIGLYQIPSTGVLTDAVIQPVKDLVLCLVTLPATPLCGGHRHAVGGCSEPLCP